MGKYAKNAKKCKRRLNSKKNCADTAMVAGTTLNNAKAIKKIQTTLKSTAIANEVKFNFRN